MSIAYCISKPLSLNLLHLPHADLHGHYTSDELLASIGISSRPSWSQQDATALAADDTLHRDCLHCSLNMPDVSVMAVHAWRPWLRCRHSYQ